MHRVTRWALRWILLTLAVVLAVACMSQPPTPTPIATLPPTLTPRPTPDVSQPPVVDLTTATTYPDGPLVADQRFAGALIVSSGEVRLFDDIGRMVTNQLLSSQEIVGVWVRDYEQDRWISAREATFVGSTNLVTPRGSGLLAVDSAERALLLARELNGRTLAYNEIVAYLTAGLTEAPLPASGGPGLGGLLIADDK